MIIGKKKLDEEYVPLLVIENKRGSKTELSGLNQTLMTLSCMKFKNKKSFAYGILCNGREFRLVEYQQNNLEKLDLTNKDNLKRCNRFVKLSNAMLLLTEECVSNEDEFINKYCVIVDSIIEAIERFFE